MESMELKQKIEKSDLGVYLRNHYRKTYIFLDGSISWCCLIRGCNSFIKTNESVTSVLSIAGSHSHESQMPPSIFLSEENLINDLHSSKLSTDVYAAYDGASSHKAVSGQVLLLADSHGRGLQQRLANYFNKSNVNVTSFIKPGAKLQDVMLTDNLKKMTSNFTLKDSIIIIGGTNDIFEHSPYQETLLKAMYRIKIVGGYTKIIFLEIMKRYDKNLVGEIFTANRLLKSETDSFKKAGCDIHFVNINHLLRRWHFTNHGLHLSHSGKELLSSVLYKHLQMKFSYKFSIQNICENDKAINNNFVNSIKNSCQCTNLFSNVMAVEKYNDIEDLQTGSSDLLDSTLDWIDNLLDE